MENIYLYREDQHGNHGNLTSHKKPVAFRIYAGTRRRADQLLV